MPNLTRDVRFSLILSGVLIGEGLTGSSVLMRIISLGGGIAGAIYFWRKADR